MGSVSRKHLIRLASVAATAAVLLPTAVAQAEVAPKAYSNGKVLSTLHVPIIGVGEIKLKSEVIGVVKCENTFYGEGWNQVVGSETRGVGEIDGWGTSGCEAPTYVPTLEIADTKQIEKHEVVCQGGYPGTEIGKNKCFTVFATAELPLETEKVEAEVCAKEGETLAKCNKEPSEKKTVKLISAVRRRIASTPWKAELIKGEREEEEVVLQRTGVHTFGEAGRGEYAQNESGPCYPKEGAKPASWKAVPSGCVVVNIVFPQIPDEILFYGSQEARGINGSKNGLFPSTLEFNEESGSFFSSENSAGVNNRTFGSVKTIGSNSVELLTSK
jgi:hypothetical protein